MLPRIILPSTLEDEFNALLQMTSQQSFKTIIIDFSTVQTVTTEGLTRLVKFLKQLHLLGLECYLVGMTAQFAIPLVDFFSDQTFLKFRRNIQDVVSQHDSKNSFTNHDSFVHDTLKSYIEKIKIEHGKGMLHHYLKHEEDSSHEQKSNLTALNEFLHENF